MFVYQVTKAIVAMIWEQHEGRVLPSLDLESYARELSDSLTVVVTTAAKPPPSPQATVVSVDLPDPHIESGPEEPEEPEEPAEPEEPESRSSRKERKRLRRKKRASKEAQMKEKTDDPMVEGICSAISKSSSKQCKNKIYIHGDGVHCNVHSAKNTVRAADATTAASKRAMCAGKTGKGDPCKNKASGKPGTVGGYCGRHVAQAPTSDLDSEYESEEVEPEPEEEAEAEPEEEAEAEPEEEAEAEPEPEPEEEAEESDQEEMDEIEARKQAKMMISLSEEAAIDVLLGLEQ